jgi:hypothetical protein
MLSRECISSDALEAFHRQAQILNRHVIAEMLQTDTLLSLLRKEFRRLFDMKPTVEELRGMLVEGVLKRDTLDGDGAKAAKAMLKKGTSGAAKRVAKAAPKIQQGGGDYGSQV